MSDPTNFVEIAGKKVHRRITGANSPPVVVLHALAAVSAEWWGLQDALEADARVLCYDRLGCGLSDPGESPRTPERVARELAALLDAEGLHEPCVLVGHSQGGLYARQFARLFPARVAGLVFVEPASPFDDRFREELDPRLFEGSGADKTGGLKTALGFARLRLGWLLKPLLVNAPPYCFYGALSAEARRAAWDGSLRANSLRTALDEYAAAHDPKALASLRSPAPRLDVPLKVVYHCPRRNALDIVRYGGLRESEAWQVEKLWEQIQREYLTLSSRSEWIQATRSGHFVHLEEPELVVDAVRRTLAESRASTPFSKAR